MCRQQLTWQNGKSPRPNIHSICKTFPPPCQAGTNQSRAKRGGSGGGKPVPRPGKSCGGHVVACLGWVGCFIMVPFGAADGLVTFAVRSAAQRATTLGAAHTLLTLAGHRRTSCTAYHTPHHSLSPTPPHILTKQAISIRGPVMRSATHTHACHRQHNHRAREGTLLRPPTLTAGAPARAAPTRALPRPQWAPAQRTGLRARTS